MVKIAHLKDFAKLIDNLLLCGNALFEILQLVIVVLLLITCLPHVLLYTLQLVLPTHTHT